MVDPLIRYCTYLASASILISVEPLTPSTLPIRLPYFDATAATFRMIEIGRTKDGTAASATAHLASPRSGPESNLSTNFM